MSEGDVVMTIQHPGNVHFFRHAIDELEDRGYDVHVYARQKDVAVELLDAFGIEYEQFAGEALTLPQLAGVQAKYEYEILKRVRTMDSPVLLAVGEPTIAHASTLFDADSLLFNDTEHATISNALAHPFADVILTPESFWGDLGSKHVRYAGNHQLAYLHPNRFEPDPTVLDYVDADEDDRIVLLRLIGWEALHDVGQSGFGGGIEPLVEGLERDGATVLISSEVDLPASLADREIDLPPHRMLDLMYYADLYVGEGLTMAIESAVLGTPAIYVSSLWAGVAEELRREYELLFRFDADPDPEAVLERATSILDEPPSTWESRRKSLLEDKIDTTDFIVDAVEALHAR